MTMIDEERLRTRLHELAETIDRPAAGPDAVLAAASVGERRHRARTFRPRTAPGRALLATAAVILLVTAISVAGAEWTGGTHPPSAGGPTVATPSVSRPRTGVSRPGTAQAGTSANGSAAIAVPAPDRAPSGTTTPPSLPSGVVGQSAKVETTGSVDLRIGVGSLGTVVDKLTQLTTGQGGFVEKSQLQMGPVAPGSSSFGSLVLQVPQPSFSSFLSQVETVGKVTSVSSTSTDVTGQYVDLQARIAALQASRQQYLTILSKATSIGDILSVQEQIDVIQSQVEQLQGQLNLLDNQTTYATLAVSLSPLGHPTPPPPSPPSGISSAWHASIGGFISGCEWLLRIAGPLLFALLLIAVLALAARWAWRASRRRLL
jgi:Domain of unknown function (DUF4349)